MTGFALDPFNSPTLSQGPPFNSTSELTIKVPNPFEDSAGGGTGNPAIKDTNTSCPALIGGLPANFTKTVPLHPGTTTLPIRRSRTPTPDRPSRVPQRSKARSPLWSADRARVAVMIARKEDERDPQPVA